MTKLIVWGSELSPFALKIQSLLDYKGEAYRLLPAEGKRKEILMLQWRLAYAKKRRKVGRFPVLSPLDEYPLVPYLTDDGRYFQFDSSAIAHWMDNNSDNNSDNKDAYFFPVEPQYRFIAQLIDEAFDEFGLYMVHHMRWVTSASCNNAGERLLYEFRQLVPPVMRKALARRFSERQVHRLPYLFSVAPANYRCDTEMDATLTPPSKEGWPATHELLNSAWEQYLGSLETLLSQQSFLLGERFTVADASVYGQLAMNIKDPAADKLMRELAPKTYDWLCSIRKGEHAKNKKIGEGKKMDGAPNGESSLFFAESLKPLINIIMETFAALMVQNKNAYVNYVTNVYPQVKKGDRLFNEKAFHQGKALYNGHLRGFAFRAVVKRFQVRVWNDITTAWSALSDADKERLKLLIDDWKLFEKDQPDQSLL